MLFDHQPAHGKFLYDNQVLVSTQTLWGNHCREIDNVGSPCVLSLCVFSFYIDQKIACCSNSKKWFLETLSLQNCPSTLVHS